MIQERFLPSLMSHLPDVRHAPCFDPIAIWWLLVMAEKKVHRKSSSRMQVGPLWQPLARRGFRLVWVQLTRYPFLRVYIQHQTNKLKREWGYAICISCAVATPPTHTHPHTHH